MNNRRSAVRVSGAVALSAAIGCACVIPGSAETVHHSRVTFADRTFVSTMLQESRAELALARLAKTRATGMVASSAASSTIAEWESLRSPLLSIAYVQAAPVRGTLDPRQRALLQRLDLTAPARFDAAFLRDIQRGNTVALDRMQHEMATRDPGVRRFIAFARPIVSSYEQMTSDDMLGEHARPG